MLRSLHQFPLFTVPFLECWCEDKFGDVPKRLKGPDSKSGRSAPPARGFKSLHLRQKICSQVMYIACGLFSFLTSRNGNHNQESALSQYLNRTADTELWQNADKIHPTRSALKSISSLRRNTFVIFIDNSATTPNTTNFKPNLWKIGENT